MNVRISKGNSKMGKVASISLPPIVSCPKNVPCAKNGCYALKSYRMYKNVKSAWDGNFDLWKTDPDLYFTEIENWIEKNRPRLFRWHVAGDIQDQRYLDEMSKIARHLPQCKFLAFTKKHDLDFSEVPRNISIIASMWPGFGEDCGLTKAWTQDGTETRVPEDALECFGNCESCGMCWSLAKMGKDVFFHKH